MRIGIGKERGKRVPDREAFGYACNRCLYGSTEEIENFNKAMQESRNLQEFSEKLIEGFFGDEWVYVDTSEKDKSWLIRFSDNDLLACHGTYEEAVSKARAEAEKRGLGFVVN